MNEYKFQQKRSVITLGIHLHLKYLCISNEANVMTSWQYLKVATCVKKALELGFYTDGELNKIVFLNSFDIHTTTHTTLATTTSYFTTTTLWIRVLGLGLIDNFKLF